MENTVQRSSWRPNFSAFVPWLIALPQWKLRFLLTLISLPLLILAVFLNNGINILPMTFVLTTLVWQAPNLREKFPKISPEQRLIGSIMLVISLYLLAATVPVHLWGLPFLVNYGFMPFIGSLRTLTVPQKQHAFLQSVKPVKQAAKTKPIKAPKTKPPTNTYRKWMAKQSKKKK